MLVASFREAQLRFPKNDAAVETPRHRRNSIRALPDSSVPVLCTRCLVSKNAAATSGNSLSVIACRAGINFKSV
jgi:hypothetical protein